MAVTLRNDAKNQILRTLRQEGYVTYAKLANLFDIYLTDDPEVVGYMIPGKAVIVLNQDLSIDQVSTLIRHEILHEFLTHNERSSIINNNRIGNHELANIAADFEISNLGYTDRDKDNARAIEIGDRILHGLVTEDQRPGWENLSFEEMYEKLLDEMDAEKEKLKPLLDLLSGLQKHLDDSQFDDNDSSSKPSDNSSNKPNNKSNKTKTSNDVSKQNDDEGGNGKSPDEKKLDDLEDKAQALSKESEEDGKPFDSTEQQRDKADVAKRIKQIEEILSDEKSKQSARGEAQTARQKEKNIKEIQKIDRIQRSSISQFKLNLNNFIADQISDDEFDTWTRLNPSYEDTEFIMPGSMIKDEKNIPTINVYWDVSGSFSDEAKTQAARSAIATLNQYVRDGDIEIHTWYFADQVSDTEAGAGGGTAGTPILDHIEQTKPTNVIVITDDGIGDCDRLVEVPGAVWYLFYDGESLNIFDHLKGKKQTKKYLVDYRR